MDATLTAATSAIARLCEAYGVQRLEVFGSAAADAQTSPPRDYDFLVELADDRQLSKARRWLALAQALESILGKPEDLVSPGNVRNSYFADALRDTRLPLYERPRTETPAP